MHVKIVGFKIHLDVEFVFKNNEMTLLSGSSGAGKSTILQAIFWGFYGNMRGIYNNARITKNLSVYLSVPGMSIIRKKNPEFLSVTLEDGRIYEDITVAQNIIDNTYGHRELWKACSYIEQKNRCSLLSGSASERMELLNALSFTGENPKEYINKISSILKEKNLDFERFQATFISELNSYTKTLEEKAIKYLYQEEDCLKIEKKVKDIEEEMTTVNEQVLAQERLSGTYNYLLNNEKELFKKLETTKGIKFHEIVLPEYPTFSTFIENEIVVPIYVPTEKKEIIDNPIISYDQYSKMKTVYNKDIQKILEKIAKNERSEKELKDIEKELLQFESNFEYKNFRLVTQEEIWNVGKSEIERKKNMEEAKTIGLQYDENSIRMTIHELTEQLKKFNIFESQIENYNKLVIVENKISSLNVNEQTKLETLESLETLDILSREKTHLISELKKGLELLSCPKCNTPLRYRNNSLTLGERDPVSKDEISKAEQEYNDLLLKIQKYREYIKLEENRNFIVKSINRDELKDYITNSRNKLPGLSQLINKISKIRYIKEEDISSEILNRIFIYQNLLKKKNSINIDKEVNKEKEDLEVKKKELQKLEEMYQAEQKRVLHIQEETRKYQTLESEKLKTIAKFEEEKRKQEERRKRVEKENSDKIKNYDIEMKKKEDDRKRLDDEKIRVQNEIQSLQIRIEENRKELNSIKLDNEIKIKYNDLKIKYEEEKKNLEEAIYTVKIYKIGKDLENKRGDLINLQNDVQTLTRLKIKACEVECKQLEDTVNNINTVLETTLPIFFNEPISLTLQLYKKVKNVDTLKPGLNLEICYKGFKYDNINSLSGGEGDRISLALLLALNFVSNSPLILLDECVSSLDGDLKENCITAIKSIPNKTVICVDHDETLEGFYDSVIEIK